MTKGVSDCFLESVRLPGLWWKRRSKKWGNRRGHPLLCFAGTPPVNFGRQPLGLLVRSQCVRSSRNNFFGAESLAWGQLGPAYEDYLRRPGGLVSRLR